jgi:hypothetical protein
LLLSLSYCLGSDFWCTYLENKSQSYKIEAFGYDMTKLELSSYTGWANASCGNSVRFNGIEN